MDTEVIYIPFFFSFRMSEFSIQSVTGGVTSMDVSKENSEHA